jgi:hypothetical protein
MSSMPAWLVDLLSQLPTTAVAVLVGLWMVLNRWCLLLAGTMAVLSRKEAVRRDARRVLRMLLGQLVNEDDDEEKDDDEPDPGEQRDLPQADPEKGDRVDEDPPAIEAPPSAPQRVGPGARRKGRP